MYINVGIGIRSFYHMKFLHKGLLFQIKAITDNDEEFTPIPTLLKEIRQTINNHLDDLKMVEGFEKQHFTNRPTARQTN